MSLFEKELLELMEKHGVEISVSLEVQFEDSPQTVESIDFKYNDENGVNKFLFSMNDFSEKQYKVTPEEIKRNSDLNKN